jgi:hypothetical protein
VGTKCRGLVSGIVGRKEKMQLLENNVKFVTSTRIGCRSDVRKKGSHKIELRKAPVKKRQR